MGSESPSKTRAETLLSAGRGVLMLLSVLGVGGSSYGWLGASQDTVEAQEATNYIAQQYAGLLSGKDQRIDALTKQIDTMRKTCLLIIDNERQNTAAWREQCR